MVDRLRALLDRPLDPSAARAIMVFASAILLGFAALFVLAASERQGRPTLSAVHPPSTAAPVPDSPVEAIEAEGPRHQLTRRRQDPQDEAGSPAARRVARALHSHRALQHVPYRSGALTVELVGARGHRAVLRVTAETVHAARAGWRRFLRRYQDAGRAYIPIFKARRSRNG